MARWNPLAEPVGKNEPIGRSLFDEPMLMGSQDQPAYKGLDYRHFEVTQADDRQLSLDRLGCTGIENKAKNYLKPRAEAAGAIRVPPKQFNGWAHVRASTLKEGWNGQSFPVIPSPITLDGIEGNTHHAHIAIEGDATFAAFRLREIFTRRGLVEKVASPEAAKGAGPSGAAVDLAKRLWRKLVGRGR